MCLTICGYIPPPCQDEIQGNMDTLSGTSTGPPPPPGEQVGSRLTTCFLCAQIGFLWKYCMLDGFAFFGRWMFLPKV